MSDEYAFSTRTRVGFSDTDAQGIVYYGRYNPYFDLARVEYLRALGVLFHERLRHDDVDEAEFILEEQEQRPVRRLGPLTHRH